MYAVRLIMPTKPNKTLEILPNPYPRREYEVSLECPEFTCLCPRTGQPDFATIRVQYVPGKKIFELKSFKLYLWSFRDEGHFHEEAVNLILDDIVRAVKPRRITVIGEFNVRGGITAVVTAKYPR
jgi:7-cyano-7-deazaguanine reductase